MMEMTWLLMWLNVSIATLIATLQLLVLYRLDYKIMCMEMTKSYIIYFKQYNTVRCGLLKPISTFIISSEGENLRNTCRSK